MDSGQWIKIKEVFSAVAELPLDERAAFLEKSDPAIREEVEKLLAASESAGDFIASPIHVENGHAGIDDQSMIGREIDDYVILDKLGEGGMGAVYLAEHRGDEFSQRVALKLIKRGMDTNAVLRRFFVERQILASLDHPNIARLLDGGSTDDGLPYFVMELIEGENVKAFCDGREYDINERLKLFQKVCNAISHAHQKLVVHRDIKPSNIVVTDKGEPKLLDFGVAKLLSPDWDATTAEATATNFRLMTPEYASPEQLRGQMTTTATDVYSLGVVLYELLTGTRPYKFTSKDPFEISREILTIEPLRPSSVVSSGFQVPSSKSANRTDAESRHVTADDEQKTNPRSKIQNPKSLRGDLDNIILKSLRKDPRDRYKSVEELSDDIDRYLKGLPVRATADSRVYRFKKFVGRNRIGTAVAALILLLSGVAVWQAVVANRERAKADERFAQVRKLANAVIFDYQDAIQKLPGATAVREKMVNDSSAYLDTLAAEKPSDPDLQLELAKAYDRLGDVRGNFFTPSLGNSVAAKLLYDKALSIKQELQSSYPDKPDYLLEVAVTFDKLADFEFGNGDQASAVRHYQNAAELREQALQSNPGDRYTRFRLAKGYRNIGVRGRTPDNTDQSLALCTKALEMIDSLLRESPDNLEFLEGYADSVAGLAVILETNRTRRAEAIEAYRRAISIRKEQSDLNPDNTVLRQKHAMEYSYLGDTFYELGNLPEAIRNYRICLETLDAMALQDPRNEQLKQDLAAVRASLAFSLASIGKTHESLEAGLSVLQILEPKYANDPDDQTTLFRIAAAREAVAKSFVNLAKSQKASTAERIKNVENALHYYQQCLPIYKDFQSKGGVFPAVNEDLNAIVSEVTAEVESCYAQLKKLKGS